MFMKRDGKDFIMHGIFDDITHVLTAKYLLDEKYFRDFEITGGHHLMESFIGLDVEQSKGKISLHLDQYISWRDAGYLPGASGNEDAQTKVYADAAGICAYIRRCTRNTRKEATSILSFDGSAASIRSNVDLI